MSRYVRITLVATLEIQDDVTEEDVEKIVDESHVVSPAKIVGQYEKKSVREDIS